jgi:hypothetical protein
MQLPTKTRSLLSALCRKLQVKTAPSATVRSSCMIDGSLLDAVVASLLLTSTVLVIFN